MRHGWRLRRKTCAKEFENIDFIKTLTKTVSQMSFNYQINSGTNQSLKLTGWGDPDESEFHAGVWTVEVWHNNLRLVSEEVTIYP